MRPEVVPEWLGEFQIEAILGEGGSGVVYSARWGPRRVALKVLRADLVGAGNQRTQFFAEARRLQAISHAGVVKVFAVGELPDGRPYLAMELLEGETLAQVVARGAMPLEAALARFGELCGAVSALHAQGLVHRDLKPENVYIVAGEHAVLLDFGIAKDLADPASTTTQEGRVRGTPAYMAPERFFGQPAGIATDVYELAVVLYVMLAGRLPWDDVVDPEARLSPRALVELAPVPEALDVEIRRALSTRAQNRPASAAALLELVRGAASASAAAPEPADTARMRPANDADSVQARPPGEGAPTAGTGQRTPLAWAPTVAAPPAPAAARARRRLPYAAGLVAVVAGGAAIAWRVHQPARAPVAHARPVAAATGSQAAAPDPWGSPPPHHAPPAPVSSSRPAPARTPAEYRAELAAAVGHLPADTRVVFAVQLGELRAQPQIDQLLDKLRREPRVTMLSGLVPPCVATLGHDADWLLFGAAGLAAAQGGTFVIRGRWQRRDLEACLATAATAHAVRDGGRVYQVAALGWLDFLDDHTAIATLGAEVDPEAFHALVRRTAGPAAHTRELLAALPPDRSLALVADGHAQDDWSKLLAIPRGSDVFGWIRVEHDGISLDFAADAHGLPAAARLEAALRPQIDQQFSASSSLVGSLSVVRDRTAVHVRGQLTALTLGLVASGIDL